VAERTGQPAPLSHGHDHPHHHAHDHAHAGHHHHDHHHHHHADPVASPVDVATVLLGGRALSLAYAGRSVLERVDIDVRPGEIVTLIGPNGAGKTSLVRVLLGLQKPDGGHVVRRPGLVVGYVPQRFDFDRAVPITVARFLGLAVQKADRARIAAVLQDVGAPDVADRQLFHLSGGQLQRVLLARALIRDPGLLVLDEPARGVDYVGEAELYDLIARLRDRLGVGVLLVSHDIHVVMATSDRVVCLNKHVCCAGVPDRVALDPAYRELFGAAAARQLALYRHHHDHAHDLAGAPVPAPPEAKT
jgi:zinc transport system ATP-binding protein